MCSMNNERQGNVIFITAMLSLSIVVLADILEWMYHECICTASDDRTYLTLWEVQ